VLCSGGLVCANGWCYEPDCPEVDCADPAEACVEGGCLPAACAGVACPAGERCARGECFPDACGAQACGDDQVCYQGACLNWNCVGIACPAGTFCADGACLPIRCASDAECDDHNPCTADRCRPDAGCVYEPQPGACNDGDGCSMDDRCQDGACVGDPLDTDGDGHVAAGCGGDDCDDARPGVHPGAAEGGLGDPSCADGLDNDCDGLTDLAEATCGECAVDADCDDGDACNGAERCAGALCQAGQAPACDDDNACTQDSCQPAQGCVNDPVANGTECGARYCSGLEWRRHTCQAGACTGSALLQDCDDGNVCTTDACTAASGCSRTHNTAACASDGNACTTDVCSGGTCRHNYLGDHASCGGLSAQRCCGGSCVDIRSSESHCGGCYAACAAGQTCEDVAATTSCSPHPSGVSGRCLCSSNLQCPQGQICRMGQPSVNNRCAPENGADCPNRTFVDVNLCPNYCQY